MCSNICEMKLGHTVCTHMSLYSTHFNSHDQRQALITYTQDRDSEEQLGQIYAAHVALITNCFYY